MIRNYNIYGIIFVNFSRFFFILTSIWHRKNSVLKLNIPPRSETVVYTVTENFHSHLALYGYGPFDVINECFEAFD